MKVTSRVNTPSRFDPLSSQGIVKALRSALFASYAIADHYLKGDTMGFSKYFTVMRNEFEAYAATWQHYYRQEQRWPDEPLAPATASKTDLVSYWSVRHDDTAVSIKDTACLCTSIVTLLNQ